MSRSARIAALISILTALAATTGVSAAGAATAGGPAAPLPIAPTPHPPPPPAPPLPIAPNPPSPGQPTLTTGEGASATQAGPKLDIAAPASLTRIYRGDDGGALYLRRLGNAVYGFGEHPGAGYAYVISGTVAGDRVTGSWWDVPKGARELSGSLELRWSQQGTRLVRSGGGDLGPDVFTSIAPNGIPWPVRQAAGFQSTTAGDLDGAFAGDDPSRHYVREQAGSVVWVAEREAQPDERPGWVSVFVGARRSGGFSGTWVDVPKGVESRSGTFGAGQIGQTRSFMLAQTGASRTKRIDPDYAVDWDAFEQGIRTALDGKVVGYGFAIMRNGGFVRTGGGGARRLEIDGGRLAFTADTQSQTASAAKTISAAAIVKALHERGLTVDTRIAPFLPSCLEKGPGLTTVTFRQILDHTTGLRGARGFDSEGSCNGRDPYDCLLDMLKKGRLYPQTPAYNNKAYDLLRFLVPLVADTPGTKAVFAATDCENVSGILHRKVAERFARYVLDEILHPVGAHGNWNPSGEFSLTYNCTPQTTTGPCAPTRPGERMNASYSLRSGSGKMAISAKDYGRFLSALDRGEIVPKGLVEQMKAERLGFDSSAAGLAGPYPWKNGGCPSLERTSWDRGCATVAMIFPGDVQAYVTVNSSNNVIGTSMQGMLQLAYDRALR